MTVHQQIGIVSLIAAGGLAFWAYSRYSSLLGQLHSWTMPFSEYEVVTISGALFAVVLLLVGLRKVKGKPAKKSE